MLVSLSTERGGAASLFTVESVLCHLFFAGEVVFALVEEAVFSCLPGGLRLLALDFAFDAAFFSGY